MGSWDGQGEEGSFILPRSRNNGRDLRHYHFKYLDRPWFRNGGMRQLVVQATNPDQRTIVVGVLCDDAERPTSEVISLIFNRWLQENDFKYLDKHFGINQITSYDTLSYRDLKDEGGTEADEKRSLQGSGTRVPAGQKTVGQFTGFSETEISKGLSAAQAH